MTVASTAAAPAAYALAALLAMSAAPSLAQNAAADDPGRQLDAAQGAEGQLRL
jgi:hypothetical protein